MAEYQFTAQNLNGKRFKATMDVPTVSDVVSRLKAQGLMTLKVHELKPGHVIFQKIAKFFDFKSVKGKELAFVTRQLAATLSAGLPLVESLEVVSNDLENKHLLEVIMGLKSDILNGTSLSAALMKYPTVFPKAYVSVIRSGEATGRMHATMTTLAQYLEDIERIKEKIKSAMQYPMFILGFVCLMVTGMVLFLIPKFKAIFQEAGVPLPWLTRFVLGISDFVIHNFPFIVIALIGFSIFIVYLIHLPQSTPVIDRLKLKIPVIGTEIIHKSILCNFCRTFGFLLSGGVDLAAALDITAQVVDHDTVENAIQKIRQRVVGGFALSQTIREHKIFPPLISKMVSVGEFSGQLPDMLSRTANYYEGELQNTVQKLLVLIEPILIIVVGIIVAIVVAALYMPIFKVSTLVQ